MNNDIKFRAWITTPKECWVGVDDYETFDWDNRMRFVSSIHFPLGKPSGKDITCESICEDDHYASGWFGNTYKDHTSLPEEIEYILMPYFGRKDRNGVDIYEDDIVICHPESKYGRRVIKIDPYKGFDNGDGGDFEVIGNIHQNPELINQ